MNLQERFSNKVWKIEGGFWIWMGAKDKNGYGKISINGKLLSSHRVVYNLFFGSIIDGMIVCHKCDNTSCVNPNHLFIGTSKDNSNDMVLKGRQNKGELHYRSKLKEKEIIQIRNLLSKGESHSSLASLFNVSRTTIHEIKHKIIWNHI